MPVQGPGKVSVTAGDGGLMPSALTALTLNTSLEEDCACSAEVVS